MLLENSLRLRKNSNLRDKSLDEEVLNQLGPELIVKCLQDFGLTEKEAKVYFTLSKLPSATSSDIASTTHMSSLQTYRALKGLLNYGLAEMSLERPHRFTSLEIEKAISLLSQEAERKFLELENKAPLLLNAWTALGDLEVNSVSYKFKIVQGSKNVCRFRLMLYKSAKKDVEVIMKPNELERLVVEGADDIFKRLSSKKVAVRGLSEVNRYNIDASKRFLDFIELHHVKKKLVPFAIIDGQEALICLSRDGVGMPENAIWTNHPELVETFKEFFETLWSISQDGESRIRELDEYSFANT
ncbi:MAG: HTH-type transcriptional regulator, sugar sensing transcriptional regulator [Thermoproteota archaeon]|nr:HTH-type transcriptional regulator, sugar sensing transcriptional regulator [Thermoproteota archaeon]